jgi:hypothetical protein
VSRRFHLQVTAAAIAGADPEKNMWNMVPDIDLQGNLLANQDPNWIVITLRGIGEMEDQRSLNPDPARSWIDLSNETDKGQRRAYVNLVATAQDNQLWAAMDKAAFDLATKMAGTGANIQYLAARASGRTNLVPLTMRLVRFSWVTLALPSPTRTESFMTLPMCTLPARRFFPRWAPPIHPSRQYP